MLPSRNGAFRLFAVFGITVYLHWSWFLVAVWRFQNRVDTYANPIWAVYDILALFGLVLLHEFGHSLSCRQVGGRADQIILWPLGGVAYVSPPQRPGAQLWCIAAGPLVNVAIFVLGFAVKSSGLELDSSDFSAFLGRVYQINLILLLFNLVPVYPLDGGQILRSLLWFVVGRGRSLLIAAAIGFVGALGIAAFAIYAQSLWFGVIAFFIFSNCLSGWRYARGLLKVAAAPRRGGVECPACHQAPPVGAHWPCLRCRKPFDPFEAGGLCPHCQAQYAEMWCLDCSAWSPLPAWSTAGQRGATIVQSGLDGRRD